MRRARRGCSRPRSLRRFQAPHRRLPPPSEPADLAEIAAAGRTDFPTLRQKIVARRQLLNHGDDGRLGPLLYRSRILRKALAHVIARIAFRVNPETERAMLAELPEMLDRIDEWIEEGVLNGEELYVADFMIAPSLAILTYRADGAEEIERRPARQLLDRLLPEPSRDRAPERSLSVASPADRS